MIADESVEGLPIGEPNKWQESGDTATAPGRTEWMDAVAWEQLVTISDFWGLRKSPISSAFFNAKISSQMEATSSSSLLHTHLVLYG